VLMLDSIEQSSRLHGPSRLTVRCPRAPVGAQRAHCSDGITAYRVEPAHRSLIRHCLNFCYDRGYPIMRVHASPLGSNAYYAGFGGHCQ
jgi:hypothetical protein